MTTPYLNGSKQCILPPTKPHAILISIGGSVPSYYLGHRMTRNKIVMENLPFEPCEILEKIKALYIDHFYSLARLSTEMHSHWMESPSL